MSTVEGGLAGAGAGEAAALEQGTMSDGEDSSSSASDASSEVGVTGEGDGRGCAHYRRGCMLVAPCCDQTFWCRFCHDAAMDVPNAEVVQHKVDRHAVKEVQCGSCGMRQPVGPSCQNEACKNSFGNYFCRICNFDDDLSKRPFHCDGCGICRVGGRENFFHCFTCGFEFCQSPHPMRQIRFPHGIIGTQNNIRKLQTRCCYAIELRDNHRCIQGSMHQDCPVCQENLFNSTSECRVLRCGHTMHRDCLRALVSKSSLARCPLCAVSVTASAGTWAQMDARIARSPMPDEYRDVRVTVFCNDCHATIATAYHVLGLKCATCGSYNTRR